jgi:tetraacyldisaccharide 4'-kinase
VEESGDEPQMLARHLTGVPIVVSAERYVAGLAAEQHFDPTVMILDDGFQHLRLARDVELLVVSKEDLTQQVLPAGRLRESLDAGRIADAVLVPGPEPDAAEVSSRLGVSRAFTVSAHYGAPRQLSPYGMPLTGRIDGPIVAVAGIARPQRFFAALRASGFTVARELVFRDHHWFDERDIARIESEANGAGARMVITTEKDAVRLAAFELPVWAYLPMRATVSPVDELSGWLRERIDRARRPMQDVTAHEGGRP